MHLRRLTINALPGIEPGFTFEATYPGVTIVTGPNAIGKSSLTRALGHLLGGIDKKHDSPALSLAAEFHSGATRWRAQRNGSQIVWQRDGEAATAPPLPSGDQINRYRLSMESLLADDREDRALAQDLMRTLRGGFDLNEARTPKKRNRGRAEERELSEALRALREAEGNYAALRADEAKLPDLEKRIDAAGRAKERHLHLEQALQLNQAISQHKSCREEMERFPPHMDGLKGDEGERLEKLDEKVEKQGRRLKECQRQLKDAKNALQSSGLADARPQTEQMARIEALFRALDSKASARDRAKQDLNEAKAELNDAVGQFEGGGEAPQLDSERLEQALKIAEPLHNAQTEQHRLQRELDLAGSPPDAAEVERHRIGVDALRAWLANRQPAPGPGRVAPRRRALLFALAGAALAIGAALAAFAQQMLWAMAGSAAAAVLITWTAVQRWPSAVAERSADNAKKRYIDAGLEPPLDWADAAVSGHLRTVEQRLADLLLRERRAAGTDEIRHDLNETSAEIERLEADKRAFAAQAGFNPELAAASFHRFIQAAANWDQARRNHHIKQAELDALDQAVAADADEIRAFLEPWRRSDAPPFPSSGPDMAIDPLRIAFDDLKTRLEEANEALRDIHSHRGQIEALQDQIREANDEIDGLFGTLGLDRNQGDELAERLRRLEDWRAAMENLRDAARDEKRHREALAPHGELIASAENGELESLSRRLQEADHQAGQRDELIEQRQALKTRLEDAGADRRLERAANHASQATEDLADRRDEALLQEATAWLLDDVEGAFKAEHEPDLLRRAKARFDEATAHAFRLELRDEGFAAWDVKQEQQRSLDELSSGTRMQLLLALRLAWTEAQEQGGESLPLFLDEALTTSDEDRFAVMAETLSRLAESGDRQIFYLCAAVTKASCGSGPQASNPPSSTWPRFASALAGTAPKPSASSRRPPCPRPLARMPPPTPTASAQRPSTRKRRRGTCTCFTCCATISNCCTD